MLKPLTMPRICVTLLLLTTFLWPAATNWCYTSPDTETAVLSLDNMPSDGKVKIWYKGWEIVVNKNELVTFVLEKGEK